MNSVDNLAIDAFFNCCRNLDVVDPKILVIMDNEIKNRLLEADKHKKTAQ